eukprot:scaffold115288_cov15-Prasinocladus_malaysianus.AAC.1
MSRISLFRSNNGPIKRPRECISVLQNDCRANAELNYHALVAMPIAYALQESDNNSTVQTRNHPLR